MKKLLTVLAAVALAVGVFGNAFAGSRPSTAFTITGTGVFGLIQLTGSENSCSYSFKSGGTATVSVLGSSDGMGTSSPTFTTISSAVSVSAPQALVFSTVVPGSSGAAALVSAELNVTSYGGTPIPATITCGPAAAVGGGSSGGATPIPTPSNGVYPVSGTVTANAGTGYPTPIPRPTSSPGNALLTVAANASAVPYSPTNPQPVTTPFVPTPIPTLAPTPLATASAGIPMPSTAPFSIAYNHCFYTSGTPSITSGNTGAAQCTNRGSQIIGGPYSSSVGYLGTPNIPNDAIALMVQDDGTGSGGIAPLTGGGYARDEWLNVQLQGVNGDGINTPSGNLPVQPQIMGTTGSYYYQTYPDKTATTADITTATTTAVVVGSSGRNIYAFYIGVQAAAAEATSTQAWEYSASTTCASGNTLILPTTIVLPTTATDFTGYYSTVAGTNIGGFAPLAVPYIIPAGDTLCLVTAGTTIAAYGIVLYAQH